MHGCGHFYANDNKTGWTLFGIEALSILAMASENEGVQILGAVGFLGSWIYDMLLSPSDVRKYNEKLNSQFYPELK